MKREETALPYSTLILETKGNLKEMRDIVAEHGSAFPILLDSGSFAREVLKVTSTPTLFVIDGEGRVRARLLDAIDDIGEVVMEIIERIETGNR